MVYHEWIFACGPCSVLYKPLGTHKLRDAQIPSSDLERKQLSDSGMRFFLLGSLIRLHCPPSLHWGGWINSAKWALSDSSWHAPPSLQEGGWTYFLMWSWTNVTTECQAAHVIVQLLAQATKFAQHSRVQITPLMCLIWIGASSSKFANYISIKLLPTWVTWRMREFVHVSRIIQRSTCHPVFALFWMQVLKGMLLVGQQVTTHAKFARNRVSIIHQMLPESTTYWKYSVPVCHLIYCKLFHGGTWVDA
jgi:hypothetical protein